MHSISIPLLKMNMLALIVVSTLVLSVYGQQNKDICPVSRTILCVSNTLLDIIKATKEMKKIADKIEYQIFKPGSIGHSLNRSAIYLEQRIRLYIPTNKYHRRYSKLPNIDKGYLINLLKEENYAFSYLYNWIKNTAGTISFTTDELFKNILNILRKDVLCNYQNILHTYSENGTSPDKIPDLKISDGKSFSFMYYTHSLVITRLLRRWIEHINDVISTLESKLY